MITPAPSARALGALVFGCWLALWVTQRSRTISLEAGMLLLMLGWVLFALAALLELPLILLFKQLSAWTLGLTIFLEAGLIWLVLAGLLISRGSRMRYTSSIMDWLCMGWFLGAGFDAALLILNTVEYQAWFALRSLPLPGMLVQSERLVGPGMAIWGAAVGLFTGIYRYGAGSDLGRTRSRFFYFFLACLLLGWFVLERVALLPGVMGGKGLGIFDWHGFLFTYVLYAAAGLFAAIETGMIRQHPKFVLFNPGHSEGSEKNPLLAWRRRLQSGDIRARRLRLANELVVGQDVHPFAQESDQRLWSERLRGCEQEITHEIETKHENA
jgi:hypothetical protein